jgi:hypothetical protein
MRLLVILAAFRSPCLTQPLRRRSAAQADAVLERNALPPAGSRRLRSVAERYQLGRDVLMRFSEVPASLAGLRPARDYRSSWMFYGEVRE